MEDGINLDFDENGEIIGLEILDAKKRFSEKDLFNIATENLILAEAA